MENVIFKAWTIKTTIIGTSDIKVIQIKLVQIFG
jgi:hypothetical protein